MWEEAFSHYLLYFCSMTIFSSNNHKPLWPLAKRLMYIYVKKFADFYGRTNLTTNVHGLIHIYNDVDNFGAIDDISAYDFINHLQILKGSCKSGNRCMEQVITRCKEFQHIKRAKNIPAPNYPQLMPNGIGLQVRADFSLKANFRNQWFLSDTNYICQFVEAKETHSSFVVVGMQYESKEEMFKLSAKDHI